MARRLAAWVMIAAGALLITITFTNHLFSAGPAFDRLSKDFRPVMTAEQIGTYRDDVSQLSVSVDELQTKALPALATQLKMSPQAFNAYMTQQFPAVAKGLQAVPSATQQFGTVINVLENERARFVQADQIPTGWLPATTIPWALLFVGIAFVIAGLATLQGYVNINWTRFGVGLAAVLVAASFAMTLPGKASASDTMNKHLTPVYTQQLITGASATIGTLEKMGTEMQTKMIPALAQALHITPAQVQQLFATNFPAVAAELQTMPATITRFNGLVSTFANRLSDYRTLKPISFVTIVWTMIGSGLAVVVFGTFGLLARRHGKLVSFPPQQVKAA